MLNIQTNKNMTNLILPTENQVEIDIQKFLLLDGSKSINLENTYKYYSYTKGIILAYFEMQNIKFNSNDFFKFYHLYTLSDSYFKFVKL
jgi:hypothetical protein